MILCKNHHHTNYGMGEKKKKKRLTCWEVISSNLISNCDMINPDWHDEEYRKNIALKNFRRNCFIVLHLSQLKSSVISFSHILLLKQRLHRTLCFGNISQALEGFGLSVKEPCES